MSTPGETIKLEAGMPRATRFGPKPPILSKAGEDKVQQLKASLESRGSKLKQQFGTDHPWFKYPSASSLFSKECTKEVCRWIIWKFKVPSSVVANHDIDKLKADDLRACLVMHFDALKARELHNDAKLMQRARIKVDELSDDCQRMTKQCQSLAAEANEWKSKEEDFKLAKEKVAADAQRIDELTTRVVLLEQTNADLSTENAALRKDSVGFQRETGLNDSQVSQRDAEHRKLKAQVKMQDAIIRDLKSSLTESKQLTVTTLENAIAVVNGTGSMDPAGTHAQRRSRQSILGRTGSDKSETLSLESVQSIGGSRGLSAILPNFDFNLNPDSAKTRRDSGAKTGGKGGVDDGIGTQRGRGIGADGDARSGFYEQQQHRNPLGRDQNRRRDERSTRIVEPPLPAQEDEVNLPQVITMATCHKMHKHLLNGFFGLKFHGKLSKYYHWREQLKNWLTGMQVAEQSPWVISTIRTKCLTGPVQNLIIQHEEVNNQKISTIRAFFRVMDDTYGGEHHFDSAKAKVLEFDTSYDDSPRQIVINHKEVVAEMRKQHKYALYCDVPKYDVIQPSDEEILGALVRSLKGLLRTRMLEAAPQTLEEAYDNMAEFKRWWKKPMRKDSKQKSGSKKQFQGKKITYQSGKSDTLKPKTKQSAKDGRPMKVADAETVCYNCRGFGHLAKDCTKPKKQKKQTQDKHSLGVIKQKSKFQLSLESGKRGWHDYGRGGHGNQSLMMLSVASGKTLLPVDGIGVVDTRRALHSVLDVVLEGGGNMRVFCDSGATLSAVNAQIVKDTKHAKLIKKSFRQQRVGTGNGTAVLTHYIPLRMRCKDRPRDRYHTICFWLVDSLPEPWIMGRYDLKNLGKVMPLVNIEDLEESFVHEATDDMLGMDLSDAFLSRIEPPIGLGICENVIGEKSSETINGA